MEPITTIAVSALVSSLVGAVVSTVLTMLKAGGRKASDRIDEVPELWREQVRTLIEQAAKVSTSDEA